METREQAALAGAFATEAVIVDSFAPYVFQGDDAALRWAEGFIGHARNLMDLRATAGAPQEYNMQGEAAFFSLPLTWEGMSGPRRFHETGGLALVLVRQDDAWRVKNYGWAVTSYEWGD